MRLRHRVALAVLITLAVGTITHVATIAAIPHRVMERVIAGGSAIAGGANRIVHSDLATGETRQIPMPSPDLLYSFCAIDARERPVEIRGIPGGAYWSISVFAANSDNVFTLNDEAVPKGREAVVTIAAPGTTRRPDGALVLLEGGLGVALIRILVADRRDPEILRAARVVQATGICRPAD